MSQAIARQQVEKLIHEAFAEGRCGEYYMVDIETTPTGNVSVFVDGDEGVTLDACVQISRILQEILDQNPDIDGTYALEVSSPGVNRSLRFLRQYLKHIGRPLKITFQDGNELEGDLKEVGHETILVEVKPEEKKAKPVMHEIPFDSIKTAYVQVRFGK